MFKLNVQTHPRHVSDIWAVFERFPDDTPGKRPTWNLMAWTFGTLFSSTTHWLSGSMWVSSQGVTLAPKATKWTGQTGQWGASWHLCAGDRL